MSPAPDVVLFDPFETLGSEVAASRAERFLDFDVYPTARELLRRLSARARLGVLSLDPDIPLDRLRRLLSVKDLIPPIDPDLVAVARRDDPTPFARLLADVGLTERDRVVFVSLDATQRTRADAARVHVAPHPELAAAVLDGDSLHYARLFARGREPDWQSIVATITVVPVWRVHAPEPTLYAIVSERALEILSQPPFADALGFEELAGSDAVARTTLVLIQVTPDQVNADADLQRFVSELVQSGLPLVRQTPRGLLVAFPGDRSPEDLHPPPAGAAHGHTRALLPDPSLLKAPARRVEFAKRDPRNKEAPGLETLDKHAFGRALESWFGIKPR